MQFGLIALGAIAGLALGGLSKEILGLVAGASILVLFAQNRTLQSEIVNLRKMLAELLTRPSEPSSPAETPVRPQPRPERVVQAQAPTRNKPEPPTASSVPVPPPKPRAPDPVERLFTAAKKWLTTGNVPVKLGVLVSFFGVAFLLKYAVENEMLSLPIELRYLAVAAAACVMLFFGWRFNDRLRVYALSLQGGGIGVLYLTIFAAFRLHFLIPASIAFILLLALTAFAGFLAVIQNAKALAILGMVGGFVAPILISTGSANHVGLFSYYLVLNAAVLGIAWFRTWRFLNVLGFVFTFGVGLIWGYQYYQPAMFSSTEPFLIVFFLFYVAIAVLFAFRQPPNLRGIVDGTLVFGTPVIAFGIQSQLVDDTEYGLAISSLVVAVLYTILAIWLRRSQNNQMRLLIQSYIALAVTFATIAIPLALDDRWTAVSWALEGAALVWIGVQQRGLLARLTGVALLIASGIAFTNYGWVSDSHLPVLNGNFLGGMLIALAALFSSWHLEKDKNPGRFQAEISLILLIWGLTWWLSVGIAEILDINTSARHIHFVTCFIALSAALLAWSAVRLDWSAARRFTLVYLPSLFLIALLYWVDLRHFFVGFGILAWTVAFGAHLLVLWKNDKSRASALWHFAGLLLITALFAEEIFWRTNQAGFSDLWAISFAALAPLSVALLILVVKRRFAWPLAHYWQTHLTAAGTLIVAQLLFVFLFGIADPGNPHPIPYLPILNPLDTLTISGLLLGLYFLHVAQQTTQIFSAEVRRVAFIIFGTMAFALTTTMVIRGVHHFGSVPWIPEHLFASVRVQAALSIYWASLGFAGMIFGARKLQRWIWITGTGLMALVVVKLFLVDLGNTATVARIVSFLGVGLLLLVVGYFAPAPPRLTEDETQASV